jgi:hypothetical protein
MEKNVFCKAERYVVFHLHKVLHSGNLLLSLESKLDRLDLTQSKSEDNVLMARNCASAIQKEVCRPCVIHDELFLKKSPMLLYTVYLCVGMQVSVLAPNCSLISSS